MNTDTYRKYYFICEGANTETFYFKRLIDNRKELKLNPLVEIRLLEKTGKDRNLSYAKKLAEFAKAQKKDPANDFDPKYDKLVVVFDGDIFEEKVSGYDELIRYIEEEGDIAGVTNPGFELFLLLHIDGSYEEYITEREDEFLKMDEKRMYSHAYRILHDLTGMNAKTNPEIGKLAGNILVAIAQEKRLNQDIHNLKGRVSSNIGKIIEDIMADTPKI